MKNKIVPGRPFEKGNKSGKGRPKMTDEQKKLTRQLKKFDGKMLVAKYCLMEYSDLLKAVKKKKEKGSSIDIFIMAIIEKGITRGDIKILQWVYERLGWSDGSDAIEGDNNNHVINLNYNVGDK